MQVVGTHHVALITDNFEELERFYTQTLGFPVARRWDDVTIVFIDVGSTTIELIGRDGRADAVQGAYGFDHLALHVDDVDEAYTQLSQAGVVFDGEPRNFQEVRIVFFNDPDGNLLELVEDPRRPGKA